MEILWLVVKRALFILKWGEKAAIPFHVEEMKIFHPPGQDCAKTDTIAQWIRPPHDDPAPFRYSNPPPPSSKYQTSFSLGSRNPQCQSARNLWVTSPPGSSFNARHITTNKVVSSFESLLTYTPLGGLLADDMGLAKSIQAIPLIGTSKERLITNPQPSTPTIIIFPPRLITNWQCKISKNAQAGGLQAKMYHVPTLHSLSKANILKCDIIITSYNTITQEFKQTNTSTSLIFKINWHHIILDEEQ
ncbi:hypothetical protein O181_035171 [Austropuccinia psidii MF-1]|uniref:Helicase ATP-binding domain-containing protein n=1 Tax=Austropuccinia psidii MF-1 TaxID=1389203 RepID=A0A9Q3D7S6_9BASI|nr:hypothetical protein [Austropuccinia psidii MF-1]